ncbi:multiple sugar transport system substrate-binding protein [Devosia crocina]|uniref:Multiple sugar transport system substrate-binding protein n=1 Tax=Devosia crocina TaxID=429728 RepID=A0A1I7NTU5_9HYPH|nr:extracellular solute-binding protein [Devosia crocina]SFV38050.1 multiple sugar transport system substrate-binding protein [Devosia crocina]
MTFSLSRRSFLASSTAALLAAGTLPSWAQQSQLRLIFWGGQARADRTYGVVDLFTKDHSDVSIEGEFLGWADYWPKVATQTAGGNQPDIIQMDYRYIGEYARRGSLAPLDEYVGAGLDTSSFDEDQLRNGTVDGKLIGISLGVAAGAAVYNTKVLADAGVEIDPMRWTYDDLLTQGPKVSESTGGAVAMAPDGSGIELLFENWLRQKGKALYADGQPAFAPEDVTEWFELWAELRAAKAIISPDEQAIDTGVLETAPLVRGKSAMNFTTSNQLVAYQTLIPDPLGIAIYPATSPDSTGGHYRNSSQYFALSSTSAAPEKAVEFINFFVNNPEAASLLGVERGVPASAAMRDAVAATLDERGQMVVQYIADLGEIAGDVPPTPPASAGEIEVALKTKSQEVSFGAQSPADAGPAFYNEVIQTLGRTN